MASLAPDQAVDAVKATSPTTKEDVSDDVLSEKRQVVTDSGTHLQGPNGEQCPTEQEMASLRRVYGKINWMIYMIAFVELCERFAYYGTSVVFVNFIQQDLPLKGPHPSAGAAGTDGQAGALGMGQRASTGLLQFNQFWSYIMVMVGGWLADEHWGRFRTIHIAIYIAILGHILIIVAAIPSVIQHAKGALASFTLGLILLGTGVGFFKCNISPLIAEQYEASHSGPYIRTEPSGERVIVDPGLTISRIYMRYYMLINVGALIGQISMVYVEKYVGFWLSFTLPTILFLLCPILMLACRKFYIRRPPAGNVVVNSLRLYGLAMRGRWSWNPQTTWQNLKAGDKWDSAKPSRQATRPSWMTFDDAWVDEVRRGFKACYLFIYLPIFWLPFGQMVGNLTSQAATLKLNGVPNDVVGNLSPITLFIFIPIFDKIVYPAFARANVRFTPIKKIYSGFFFATLAMVAATLIQHYIYKLSPCGKYASSCIDADGNARPPNLLVWVQTPIYVLSAFSEIFTAITGLEYAYQKAPKNMRSLVMGVFMFTQAFSSAISQAFVPLAADPLLVWLYMTVSIITALGGIMFWWTFRGLDKEDDRLNLLPEGDYAADNTPSQKEPGEKA